MLTGAFRRDQPAVLLGLLVIVAILWLPGSIGAATHAPAPLMPLMEPIAWMVRRIPWADAVLGSALTLGIAIQLARLAQDAELLDRRNNLPALLFPLLLGLSPLGLHLDPALAGMPFLLWGLRRAWVHQPRSRVPGALFDAGLLIGLASLFHLPYVFMLVVLSASSAVMRPFQWRDHVIPAAGAAVSFYLCWGVWHVAGARSWHGFDTIATPPSAAWTWVPRGYSAALAGVGLAALPFTIAAFARSYRRSVIHGKNMRAVFLAFTTASGLLAGFAALLHGTAPPVLHAAPLAVLFAYPLLAPRVGWLAELAVWGIAALALWAQWSPLSSPA